MITYPIGDIRPCPAIYISPGPQPPDFMFIVFGLLYLAFAIGAVVAIIQRVRGRGLPVKAVRIWIGCAVLLVGGWLVCGTLFWGSEDCGEISVAAGLGMWTYQSPGVYLAFIGTVLTAVSLISRTVLARGTATAVGMLLMALSQWPFFDYNTFGIAGPNLFSLLLLTPFFVAMTIGPLTKLDPPVKPEDDS